MSKEAETSHITVVFWGTYDLGKPRTRILREGLQKAGVNVIEIHADVWSRFEDKSQISKRTMAITLLNLLLSYPVLIYRYLRAPQHDMVLIPYLGQFDVLALWPFARLRAKPIVWDMFLSLYDTVVNDRKMAARWTPLAVLLKVVEWLGCRAASCVLLDTKAHAAYISELFSLPPGRSDAVPVSAETTVFPRQPPREPHDGPTKVLFYGQLIPLHGVETIMTAALSERGRTHAWRIIGKGQQSEVVKNRLATSNADHIQHEDWVAYDSLITAIAETDICLGIFGSSRKAASVVPNKVYQCLAAGRTVVTRQSPAIEEVFPDSHAGLMLIPDANPSALLDAIEKASAGHFPTVPEEVIKAIQPQEIGRMLCENVLIPLIAKTHTRN